MSKQNLPVLYGRPASASVSAGNGKDQKKKINLQKYYAISICAEAKAQGILVPQIHKKCSKLKCIKTHKYNKVCLYIGIFTSTFH